MPSTRSSTGHSKPRVHLTVSTEPERKHRTSTSNTKRSGGTTTTTTTTTTHKTRTGAGVTKQPATHHKRKPHLSDKIAGAAEKLVGTITRRPGKKAAGTRKMRGTDGKGSRAKRVY
ncbi:uncharacterized protein GGS25DRAFT_470301 [Hypoxylon fragiforme]|uniref:uncharacterized protein n=1 Tax=Hypoxylon fragiforme TaxID=63214 RepID=UPI0020C5D1F5|nr:uncharacterized protein GGS25DRAFT_470301 [Hypoxylon fragiforme]KAI2614089.1 hypothetical protein GGS25DRAFT_470301 [Hypoxylon fragiforme]